MSKKDPVRVAQHMADRLLDALEDGLAARCRREDLIAVLRKMAGTIEVKPVLGKAHEEDIEDEAFRRNVSSLSWASNEDLMAEVQRRRLPAYKVEISKEQFEKEARERGYHSSLAEFPRAELLQYLQIQSH